ncbi:DNA cytosine methyltransferase [Cellulophaga baltica]|uniref:DNA cytosine methyltransferase n=1 Tax=Cellulophaga baltica TaxID=76594 RepID=UPI0004098509|nr:DNA cytosine methyltransferase [Cellulophaga baltica]
MKDKLNVIDLFSGCGGLSEGLLQFEHFDLVAHVEWELPMIKTLRNRLVDTWNHSFEEARKRAIFFDIQKTKELINGDWGSESKKKFASDNDELVVNKGLKGLIGDKKIDIIVGGPPCQAYSIHGRATDPNSMKDDYRNYLFESFAKIVENFKPELFVFENVPGILSSKPGGIPIIERISKAFDSIGYKILDNTDIHNSVFDCSEYSVPQNRKRVLIIGVKKDSVFELNDFYESIKRRSNKDNKKTVRDAIGFLPAIYPLKTSIKEGKKNISHRAVENNILQHIPRYNNSRDIEIFKEWVRNKMNYIPHQDKIDFYYKMTKKKTLYSKYRSLEWDKQSYTIVAHLQKDGLTFIHPDAEQARSITIREAALLMTFPIDYKFIGSNAYCYKMIGNAVPVTFAKALGQSIYEVFSNKEINKEINKEYECIDSV